MDKYFSTVREKNNLNHTCIPFFDIEYSHIDKIFIKEDHKLPLFQRLEKNIEVLERVFGYDFNSNPLLHSITNHSLVSVEQEFPDLKTRKESGEALRMKLNRSKTNNLFESPSTILSEDVARQLVPALPTYLQGTKWLVLYNNTKDGSSFITFERSLKNQSFYLIVVMDTHGAVFGGLFSGRFEFKPTFFGTGESFLFNVVGNEARIYKATMANNMFCFADENGFGMGSQ